MNESEFAKLLEEIRDDETTVAEVLYKIQTAAYRRSQGGVMVLTLDLVEGK